MWAQCLGHKNTSRVRPPERTASQSVLFLVSFSSWPEQQAGLLLRSPDALGHTRKETRACCDIAGAYPSASALLLKSVSGSSSGPVYHPAGGRRRFLAAGKLQGYILDIQTRLKERRPWDSWAAAPPLTQPTSLTLLSSFLPSCVSPPGYPFWPRKSPDPALRVC